ncbi:MAG: phosphosulfolactate synthase, partial [Acidimicrobiales bacterium]
AERRGAPAMRSLHAVQRLKEGAVMNSTVLTLPGRATKPRRTGMTMVVDGGLPLGALRDVVASAGEYIDFVKFGWGTAVVSGELGAKIELLQQSDIDFYFGGTLFEKHVLQGRFDDYRVLCHRWACRFVEVSNGTIEMSNHEKTGYVRKLAEEFVVISEVGFKDAERSDMLMPRRWIEYIEDDLSAGAFLVTLEARETGSSGICHADGQLRVGLVEEIVSEVPPERLVFEAPTSALQAHMVRRVGPDVNLGNVGPASVLALETLRLGLRADTLTQFEGEEP